MIKKVFIVSMRMKAALLIKAIVFAFTVASFILSMSFIRQNMTKAMEDELRLALDIADDLVSTKIELLKSNALNISDHLIQAYSPEEITKIMASMLAEYTEFLSLAVLNQNGIVANHGRSVCTSAGYDNSIYLKRALSGEANVSTTHYDDKQEYFIIHIFVPMGQDLVLSATIPGMTFSYLISGFKLWETGNLYIIDEEATIIANVHPNLVYDRYNFIKDAESNHTERNTGEFFQNMLDTDSGDGQYDFNGQPHLCVYKKISSANTGWKISVTAPINESPLQNVQHGLMLASLMFLLIGIPVAFFVSGVVIKPFIKIEAQNKTLAELYDEIQAHTEQIRNEHERVKLLLDATPLACRLWNRKYEIFECNDETVRLFELKNKQEYIDRFFELSPEYQPDGQLSTEKTRNIIDKVFEEGRYVYKWMHQLLDGTPLPAEITLVRVTYEGDDVIAGYTRDLREHERMMSDIKYRDDMLNTMNRVAVVLLAAANEENFEDPLKEGMELIGRYLGADCVQVWPNETIDDKLHFVLKYKWLSETGKKAPLVEIGTAVPYSSRWMGLFLQGENINGPISSLPKEDQDLLSPLGITSTITIPLFYQEKFWGVFCVDDCVKERYYSEGEAGILRSAALMLVNAINRNLQLKEIKQKSNLLDSMNKAANMLLQAEINKFDDNLHMCMGMIGKAVNADRLSIWKNKIKEGKLYCTLISEWVEDEDLRTSSEISTDVPYEGNLPTWERFLKQGMFINTLARNLSPEEQVRMNMYGIKSVFAAPVFVHDEFWGVVSCDNCQDESVFSEEVATTLYSGSLLIANALFRNEMTLNLQKAAEELKTALMDTQKANNAKSDFLANMSHEMRTPLNAIIGLSELALEDEKINEDAKGNLEKISSAGDTLLSLVNSILDISKIEAGKFELIEDVYDTSSLINDTVTNNILRIGSKPINFVLNIRENLPSKLYGDELRIKQVLSNLLSNAFKYTKEGTVELGMDHTREGEVIWLTAWVTDTGIGIKEEDINKLFSDYAQMDAKSNRMIEGTGLGLTIAQKMTELMDGTINVESEYGKGSTFTIRIKQKHISDEAIGQETSNNLMNYRYSNHKRNKNAKIVRIKLPYARVLVVDDIAANLDVAKGLLKPYSMQIDTAASGQQAIDAIQAETVRYNAIFMDHMMPGMDGIEAAERIRKIGTEYSKNIPIIALTANAISGNDKMFINKGFQDFLSKPIDLSRLDAVIRRWIRDKSKEKEETGNETQSENDGESLTQGSRLLTFKIDGIDLKAGLARFSGDTDAYLQVLRSYTANTRNLLASINGVDSDNLHNYAITVHGIRGSSRSICANHIGDMAEALEKAAKEGDWEYVNGKKADLTRAITSLLLGLEGMLAKISSLANKPLKPKPDQDVLFKMLEACKTYDMDTVEAALKELESYEYETDGELVPWLWENVQQFNIDKIIERLKGVNKHES